MRWRLGRARRDITCWLVGHLWVPYRNCVKDLQIDCRYCARCGKSEHLA